MRFPKCLLGLWVLLVGCGTATVAWEEVDPEPLSDEVCAEQHFEQADDGSLVAVCDVPRRKPFRCRVMLDLTRQHDPGGELEPDG